ncbi:MAG: homoserine O-succinyltransferase [Candidatus Methanoplasma sp.]|jgi:homoserine O-succinyltransferase|nr:homoserine O-succinyltransferase [Candidatus Methanoplasma sp.]
MPINIPDDLPAGDALESENIFVMREGRATSQDIRPMKILVLNLMPTKIETEIQVLRLLGNSPLQTDISLLQMATHESKNTSQEYLDKFYYTFDEIKERKFDGMIITGAPVENISFEDVDYWDELCEIMEWSVKNVTSTLHICWGAQAGLYYHYDIPKYPLDKKMSGIFGHTMNIKDEPLLRGFDDVFNMPHSRHTEVRASDISRNPRLHVAAESKTAGLGIVTSEKAGQVFVTGHFEYDSGTLAYEYYRDQEKGLDPHIPDNYFRQDDPQNDPVVSWRAHATLLFTNWLNYYVYQQTPYDINEIGTETPK